MSASTWLARRELTSRPARAVVAMGVVAAAVALGAGLELLARSREVAAAARVDGMGPAVRVVPAGVGGSALARLDLGGALLPPDTSRRVISALGGDLRSLRPRLILTGEVAGRPVPIVGGEGPRDGTVELGSALAERVPGGGGLRVAGTVLEVARAREATGTAEDGAAHVSLAVAQGLVEGGGLNELQLFLRAGVAPARALARLEAALPGAKALSAARGEVADVEIPGALSRARALARGVLAILVVLGLAVAAHLDAAERRVEAATLVAIGAVPGTVLSTLLVRSLVIGAAGGLAGVAIGVALAVHSEPALGQTLVATWPTLALVPIACALLGMLAAAPVGIAMARRDPVAALQES